MSEPDPLLFDPAGELGKLGKGKVLQKRPIIELEGVLDLSPVEGGQKVPEVAADDGGIQPDRQSIDQDDALAQVTPKSVEGLMQGVPGPLCVALGPQVEKELVA
jgi:hypothetical protein